MTATLATLESLACLSGMYNGRLWHTFGFGPAPRGEGPERWGKHIEGNWVVCQDGLVMGERVVLF